MKCGKSGQYITDSIEVKAYCKINIALDIKGVRSDGYHEVEMIMQTIPLYDKVKIKNLPGEKAIQFKSDAKWLPCNDKNTAYKAARLLREKFKISTGTHIFVEKKIPACGGLGGSSADAAAVLLGMNRLYNIGLSVSELQEIGAQIGADVPFLIKSGASIATGTGTELEYIEPLREGIILIVNNKIEVSAHEAYSLYDELLQNGVIPADARPDVSAAADIMRRGGSSCVARLCRQMKNVLEYPAFRLRPQIAELKNEILSFGAETAMMSGSGGSVFGVFGEESQEAALRAEMFFSRKGFFTFLCDLGKIDIM